MTIEQARQAVIAELRSAITCLEAQDERQSTKQDAVWMVDMLHALLLRIVRKVD